MFKATRPFKDTVTNYSKEPSLRIGRTVPDNAVNLAYYCNPTATDAEKVLTSEAPRNTIDHRVEEAYRYLFNRPSDDDDQFPGSVRYEDEEGYAGNLGRMYVNWYPEAHILTKNVQETKTIHVVDKSDLPKMIEYSDAYGYSGNLYLDATDYEVHEYKDETYYTDLDRLVLNHEVNAFECLGSYIEPTDIDTWMAAPTASSNTYWPYQITVEANKIYTDAGHSSVKSFINKQNPKEYDGAIGVLTFSKLQYEPVEGTKATDGKISSKKTIPVQMTKKVKGTGYGDKDGDGSKEIYLTADDVKKAFTNTYLAEYDSNTHKFNYDAINAFISDMPSDGWDTEKKQIQDAMDGYHDIAIFIDNSKSGEDYVNGDGSNWGGNDSHDNNKFNVKMSYAYKISSPGTDGQCKYNVVAVYSGTLVKRVEDIKTVPACYTAKSSYVGIARKVWYDYDGIAYYRGAVTKGNGVGNMNPDTGDNEILMFSDDQGFLRRPVTHTESDGTVKIKNFYRVEADYIYLTDVFKNNKACFYKYPLKQDIYDYRGPDTNGFYEGNACKVFTAGLKDLPDGYEYGMKLKIAETEIVNDISNDFQLTSKEIPKRYKAELYTSFVSCSTDTFQVTYNAFNDNDEDNIALDNGITEDIYNYPFMYQGIDYELESVDLKARVNRIKLLAGPYRLYDSRHYVTFSYKVVAERKGKVDSDNKVSVPPVVIKSEPITVSILNKDYALPVEYDKFINRGMIISPFQDELYLSPFEIILRDQSLRREETKIKMGDTDFVFSVEITEINPLNIGGVNIICDPNGNGIITAETTIDTGFIEGVDLWSITPDTLTSINEDATYTKKLALDAPYYVENGWIYPGMKVKCVDSRYIKVQPPRDDGLLDSWYPMIQFGHYSQILDQYGTHIKVCYTMPEYDKQHYSETYKKPYVDVKDEKVEILNSHMVKTRCFPLFVKEINLDADTYIYGNKIYKVFKKSMTWKKSQEFCQSLGGNLAMPKNEKIGDFIISIANKYDLNGLWLGATDEAQEGIWKWVDGTTMTYSNWNAGEPNNLNGENYLETYTRNNAGKWNDLANDNTSSISGFICEWGMNSTIKLYKKVDDELFEVGIKDISFSDGIIITEDAISENDNIICNYTYVEENYIYRGYWRNRDDFARIDLNPNIYHTYSDLNYTPSEDKPTKNLFNKVIYYFMRPTVEYEVSADNDSLIYDLENDEDIGTVILENENTLYHKIGDAQPDSEHDIYIGSVFIRQNTSLHSTMLVDSRTRGGGIIESMKDSIRKELEPESDYYLDIGYYDGEPYQENGVIIIRLDNSILKEFGGRFTQSEIETKVKRWLGFGVYPIIEYVDSYSKYDMPQYNLLIEDSYSNVIDEIPEFTLNSEWI